MLVGARHGHVPGLQAREPVLYSLPEIRPFKPG